MRACQSNRASIESNHACIDLKIVKRCHLFNPVVRYAVHHMLPLKLLSAITFASSLVFHTVGFHNFNLRIFNLRVSNPNKLIADVFLTRWISMCQGLGPKKHDEISEIDRRLFNFKVEITASNHICTLSRCFSNPPMVQPLSSPLLQARFFFSPGTFPQMLASDKYTKVKDKAGQIVGDQGNQPYRRRKVKEINRINRGEKLWEINRTVMGNQS